MKSKNFEFLRAKRPILADLADFTEQHAYSNPARSLIKQRSLVAQGRRRHLRPLSTAGAVQRQPT